MTEKPHEEVAVVVGTGHLGVHLAEQLVEQGRDVRVLAYNKAPVPKIIKDMKDVRVYYGDVVETGSLREPFCGAGVVYLAAALISLGKEGWEKMYRTNVLGVRNVSEIAGVMNVPKVIYFSSIHAVEQSPVDVKLNENRELLPVPGNRTYGESKAEGERVALAYIQRGIIEGCILAPTGIIGPKDHMPSEFGTVLLDMARGKMPILPDAGMDWVDVRDVAAAALTAEQAGTNGSKYLVSGGYHHLRVTAEIAACASGTETPVLYIPMEVAQAFAPAALWWAQKTGQRALFTPYSMEALAGNRKIDPSKAKNELGFKPRPHEQTVTEAVDWLVANFK